MPLPVMPRQSDRLTDVRGRLAELRQRRNRAQEHVQACKQALTASGGQPDVNSEAFRRAENAIKDLNEIQASISLTEQEENYVLSQIAGVDGALQRESFLSEPTVLEDLRQRAESSQPIGDLNLGAAISRDELLADWQQRRQMAAAGDVTLPSDQSRTAFYGVVPQLRRRLSLLDLIPVQPMDVGQFDYLIEGGTFTGAAETADLAVKPSANVALTEATAKAQTIPAWLRLSRPQLADVPGLGVLVNSRLRYICERRLESQILAGDGTGNNLLGILSTSGIGAPASVTGDTVNTDLVANGLSTVLTSEAEPNAVVLNPVDYVRALKVKSAGSGERLDSDGAFSSDIGLTMWGLPCIHSTALAQGTALIGDFSMGATVFLREAFNIRISDSDQDDFVRNAVKVLGELRAGLAVWRPAAFAKVTLSFPA
jgi:HK97 family phage major capsid protein